MDRVEPLLYPLLRRDLMTNGPKKSVQVGDKQVDWQDAFRAGSSSPALRERLANPSGDFGFSQPPIPVHTYRPSVHPIARPSKQNRASGRGAWGPALPGDPGPGPAAPARRRVPRRRGQLRHHPATARGFERDDDAAPASAEKPARHGTRSPRAIHAIRSPCFWVEGWMVKGGPWRASTPRGVAARFFGQKNHYLPKGGPQTPGALAEGPHIRPRERGSIPGERAPCVQV